MFYYTEKLTSLREEVVRVTRRMVEQDLISSSDGNVSVRLDEARILITPSGCYKLDMTPDMLLVVDRQGHLLEGSGKPTSEIRLHLEAYRIRPDVRAVVHAHPPYCTSLTVAGEPYPLDLLPELATYLGDVPTAPYGRPGGSDLADSIRGLIEYHDAVLLSHHGSLTVGPTLEDALIRLERVEHGARIYALAKIFGMVQPLPPGEVEQLREIYRRSRGNGSGNTMRRY